MNTLRTRTARSLAMLAASVAAALIGVAAHAAGEEVVVYKDPGCGCCGAWGEHMRAAGFKVKEIPSSDMDGVKRSAGVPKALGSCHTAHVGGYVIEGHVPAADVKRLLAERPKVAGLAAPGMPMGSPGMEGPYPADHYNVVSFGPDGKTQIFAKH